jgi:serine/threonine protein kinase
MNATEYVRLCPVCGAEHPPAASQCGTCGTLLLGVDLTLRARPAAPPAIPPTDAPVPETASRTTPAPVPATAPPAESAAVPEATQCPHADCGALNPAGLTQCLYCGRPMTEAPAPAPAAGLYNLPAALAANFAIERVLPAGGAEAELMLLKGLKTGVRVMAKLYRPGIAPKGDVLERVGRVARVHVVPILAHGISDGVAYEVMEYCAGGSLRDLMGEGPMAPARVRLILTEVAEALAALHEIRVVHRDLKPENVLVRRPHPLDLVLTDFGIASLQDATQFFTGTARTARYAAPEAMTGVLDEAADYWSLGIMLLEMLLGAHPFEGLSDPVIAHRLATGSVDVSDIRDPAWRKLCRGLLQRDPARRWGIAEVRRWLTGDESLAEPVDTGGTLLHPYRLGDEECRSTTELALALSRQWGLARKDLMRGQIEAWARDDLKDHNLVRFLHDLRDRGGSGDQLLFLLIRHLAPDIPLNWRGESLGEESLLAAALKASERDKPAAEWLESIFADDVLALLPAPEHPALADLEAEWTQAWRDFVDAWQAADKALGAWRQGQVDRGEVVVDFDSMVFGIDGGLHRPPAGFIHGPLLLCLRRPDYARKLRTATIAEASAHFGHSPWLEGLCRQAETEDAKGIAALVAVLHLLPQARKASDDGHQRIVERSRHRTEELDHLAARANGALADIRRAVNANDFDALGRARLTESIEAFLMISAEARVLRGGDDVQASSFGAVLRAEPLVRGIRDRLDRMESGFRINALWRNRHLANTVASIFVFTLVLAPRWLFLLVPAIVVFWVWRESIAAGHRRAIRRLAAGLPVRLSRAAPS